MEWTGVRYADGPTVEVDTWVDAPPEVVWGVVSDVTVMPEMSDELATASWTDPTTPPGVGSTFVGTSKHDALGEWSTTSHVVEWDPPRRFAWAVEDADTPSSLWRFTLDAKDGGTLLRQWMRIGPGRSGLSFAIDAMPDKEQKIVFVRMREFEKAMSRTVADIKRRVEAVG
ncbi:SRPBCC family protein [Gordonia rhizosphera]|uniref:Putative oxidoreductase n=1 Tax=Gordonia rhizosphera NBRC 16068 TaxID=1108045 RepID=K6WXV2_9ACTN|nr:SRPBCC family protein [Gordonia rhizosphera]GAB91364.1 putative oxidoreductase [Gordonia rhizosphera NBRC 16068]